MTFKRILMRKDVSLESDMLIVSFRYSKTIQFWRKNFTYSSHRDSGLFIVPCKSFFKICAVLLLLSQSSSTLVKPEDPLFFIAK